MTMSLETTHASRPAPLPADGLDDLTSFAGLAGLGGHEGLDPEAVGEITNLLRSWENGGAELEGLLLERVYRELQEQADRYLRRERFGSHARAAGAGARGVFAAARAASRDLAQPQAFFRGGGDHHAADPDGSRAHQKNQSPRRHAAAARAARPAARGAERKHRPDPPEPHPEPPGQPRSAARCRWSTCTASPG